MHTVDDYGTEVAGNLGEVDLEFTYVPPKAERLLCALDERFDAQDAVANDHERRIAWLEQLIHQMINAENVRTPEGWVSIPAAEWEALCAELEGLRKFKANDSGERFISGDEWAGMYAQLKALRAFKASVPWAGLKKIDWADETRAWFSANAPEEATE
jgi:hypothetical protein